jgi:hypothetical protein
MIINALESVQHKATSLQTLVVEASSIFILASIITAKGGDFLA